MSKEHRLTHKQRKFVEYFVETGLQGESAIRAGYSENTASEIAYENLKKPHIIKAIEDMTKGIESDTIASIEEVREFWTNTMRGDYIECKDRLKASEMLARSGGAFLDKVEHSGSVDSNIEIIIDGEEFD